VDHLRRLPRASARAQHFFACSAEDTSQRSLPVRERDQVHDLEEPFPQVAPLLVVEARANRAGQLFACRPGETIICRKGGSINEIEEDRDAFVVSSSATRGDQLGTETQADAGAVTIRALADLPRGDEALILFANAAAELQQDLALPDALDLDAAFVHRRPTTYIATCTPNAANPPYRVSDRECWLAPAALRGRLPDRPLVDATGAGSGRRPLAAPMFVVPAARDLFEEHEVRVPDRPLGADEAQPAPGLVRHRDPDQVVVLDQRRIVVAEAEPKRPGHPLDEPRLRRPVRADERHRRLEREGGEEAARFQSCRLARRWSTTRPGLGPGMRRTIYATLNTRAWCHASADVSGRQLSRAGPLISSPSYSSRSKRRT